MYAAPGVGLAAPQVGVPLRVCVIDLIGRQTRRRTSSRSSILSSSHREGMQVEDEGCLSVPGFTAIVSPARHVSSSRASTATGSPPPSKARACSRGRCSTSSITSTACCFSTGCGASNAISSSGRSGSSQQVGHSGDMRIAFFGTPAFAVPSLDALAASPHHASRRGHAAGPAAGPRAEGDVAPGEGPRLELRRAGAAAGAARRTTSSCTAFDAWQPDLGVVAAYGRILPQLLLDRPRLGMINVHASLLPRWRGAAPIHRAILAGDAETGVTIMRVVLALDAGPDARARRRCRSAPTRRAWRSRRRLADAGARPGWSMSLDRLDARCDASTKPQDESLVTYAARIERADSRVDWTRPARDDSQPDSRPASVAAGGRHARRPTVAAASSRASTTSTRPAPRPDTVDRRPARRGLVVAARAGRRPSAARAARGAPGRAGARLPQRPPRVAQATLRPRWSPRHEPTSASRPRARCWRRPQGRRRSARPSTTPARRSPTRATGAGR